MKNKLKLVYVCIAALTGAVLFGTLVGNGDPVTSYVAALISFGGALALSYGYSEKEQRSMAMTCGAITAGITLNCNDPLSSGVVAKFYIANKADIASYVVDPSNPMLVTDITMAAGKTFFEIEGQLQSTQPLFAMIKGTYVNNFEHTVSFLIFKVDPATKVQQVTASMKSMDSVQD
jgi:hypothetical protein